MKQKIIFFILFCNIACIACSAKIKVEIESIDKLIAQTEKYLAVYDTLRPCCEYYYPIKDFTEQELAKLKENGDIKNDSIDSWYVIDVFQERILENIDKIAHHKDFPKKGSGFFLVSPDNKLFNFTLFENTGGSYRSRISVIYYKENNEIKYYENRNTNGNIFNTDGYYSIDTIQTNSGVKYLLQGDNDE